jgi:protein O-GlcNAc transferase
MVRRPIFFPAVTIPQVFTLALEHQRAGRLNEAATLYRQILAAQPNHADALHSLGLIAHQMGRQGDAIEWLRRAIHHRPNDAAMLSNLGVV